MNTLNQLLTRLLRLYPVRLIKEFFHIEGMAQDEAIQQIIQGNTEDGVKNFSLNNIDSSKQHVYLYSLDGDFNRNNFVVDDFPLPIIREDVHDGKYTFLCLPLVNFNAVVTNPFEEIEVNFFQPIKVTVKGRSLIIHATILEKNLNYQFDNNRRVLDVVKSNDENESIENIVGFFRENYTVEICDFNRGIKHLWETDVIDSKYVKWKKPRSVTTESMDEEFTVKTQYPDVYASLIISPLNKTIFKYLLDNDDFCSHFTADPTKGLLSFSLYPENLNQIQNVITEILSNN